MNTALNDHKLDEETFRYNISVVTFCCIFIYIYIKIKKFGGGGYFCTYHR